MQLKVVFDKNTGRVLGGQAIAPYSAEKHIDVLAVAIQAHMTMSDLEELDLCLYLVTKAGELVGNAVRHRLASFSLRYTATAC